MANKGLDDIADFESKMQFALMAMPIAEIVKRVRRDFEGTLTSVTLESWRTGRNRPSRTKLELFCRVLAIRVDDFYEELDDFVDIVCRVRKIPERDRDIYLRRIEEKQSGCIKLDVFSRYDPNATQRLFSKIQGNYILYNYSINNVPVIHQTCISVECPCHPFIRVAASGLRDGGVVGYRGTLFPVRSNLHIVLETCREHDEVVMIVTNNPMHMGGTVRFLYGVIVSGSEDFVSHPSAARVFMEKMDSSMTPEQVMEKIQATEQAAIPSFCRKLLCNDIDQENGDYVLRAEQLNMAYVRELMEEK